MLSKYQDMAKIVSKTSKFLIEMIYFLRIRPWMCIRYQQFSTSIIISSLITTNITANQDRSIPKYDVYSKTGWLPFFWFYWYHEKQWNELGAWF